MKISRLFLIIILLTFLACAKKEINENEVSIVFRSEAAFTGGRNEGIGRDWDYIQDLVAEKMPGTTLKFMAIQAPEGEYFTKLALALKNDSAYDIVSEDSFMLQSDVAAGLLAPLDVSDWNDWNKFYPGGRDAATIDGKVYTVPWNTDARGLWYSKKLFKLVGIDSENWQPKNWNEILDVARKIKALGELDGKPVVPFMLNLSRVSGEATTMQTFLMLLYGTDDKLYEDGKWVVESQGIMDTLRFIDTLRKEDLVLPNDILLTTGAALYSQPIIVEGNVGIRLDGSWVAGGFEPIGLTNWRPVYGYTGMPTRVGLASRPLVTFQGGFGFSISARSEKKEKAWEVIKVITEFDSLNRIYQISGHLTTREDVATTPEHEAIGVNKISASFLPYGYYRPAREEYPAISAEIQVLVDSVVSGTAIENAMKSFSRNVEAIIGGDNVIRKPYN